VRNLWSGQVEAVLEGEREAVEQVLEWCRHGPPSARVDDVRVQWREPAGDWQAFNIRATASEVND
jgi:acylphosphatase